MGMIEWSDAPQFGRVEPLKFTLELLHTRRKLNDRPQIIEIGTSYQYNLEGLGNATLAFAWYAKKYNARFVSVDAWQGSIDGAKEVLDLYGTGRDSATFLTLDGQLLHTMITEAIALMYVDGPSFNNQDVLNVNDKNESLHMQVVQNAMPILPVGALVLFDDTIGVKPYETKGKSAIPWMLTNGWKILPWPWGPIAMTLLEKI
jgi:predicted O-methyltransferase YrrM